MKWLIQFGLGLALEQQKKLLPLQLQQEQWNVLEAEKLRHEASLQETELAHVQATQKIQLEVYRLDLISEGKLQAEPKREGSMLLLSPTPAFDVIVNLLLVPKFNEMDPDIFFVLFQAFSWSLKLVWWWAYRTAPMHVHWKSPGSFLSLEAIDSGSRHRNFTRAMRAMALVPSQFGPVPLKKISALRPQWPWCPAHTALVDFAVFSSATSNEMRRWPVVGLNWAWHEPLGRATTTVWQQSITG